MSVYVATCPVCGSRDEYTRPDPAEHTCGHRESAPVPLSAASAMTQAVAAYEAEATARVIASPKSLASVLLEAARRGLEAAAPQLDFGAGYEAGRSLYHTGAYINGWNGAMNELAVWCEQKAAAAGEPDATTLKAVAAHARERAR